MLDSRSLLIGGIAGFTAALLGVGFVGCQKKDGDEAAKATSGAASQGKSDEPALPPQSAEELSTPLATVDDVVITVGEFQDRVNRQSPYIRARYTSLEQKKEFLQNLIRFEVLAKEGIRRGYDKDPEVVRTMKQVMIQKLMKEQFDGSITPEAVTEEEMRAFYQEHLDDYNRPEEVRASVIVLASKADADKVANEAKGEAGKNNTGFRQLVTAHSTDEESKLRGGDLRYFDRNTDVVPKPVAEAAFGLEKTGAVAGPIEGGDGKFYILKLTGRRKALSKSFDEVKRQIQNRLYRDRRSDSQQSFIDGLEKKSQITIHEENLAKVRVDASPSAVNKAGAHGALPSFEDLTGAGDGHDHGGH